MLRPKQTDAQIAAANIGHFDHTCAGVPAAPAQPGQFPEGLEQKLGPGRLVDTLMKFEQMDIMECVGGGERRKKLLLAIPYHTIAVLEWDHATSSVKVQMNGTRDQPAELYVVLKVVNSLELENEVKLRLKGLADGGTISLTFSYVGVFAGSTKPKPFQRKRANVSQREQGKLPQLSTMRDLAIARHLGSGTPASGMSRRLRSGLDQIHNGENAYTVVNSTRKGKVARSEMLEVESKLRFTFEGVKYTEGNKVVLDLSWDDVINWAVIDRAHEGEFSNGLDIEFYEAPAAAAAEGGGGSSEPRKTQKWFFVVLDVLMMHYALQYYWNSNERKHGRPPRAKSTHGRSVVSVTTLLGVVEAPPVPVGDVDVVDDHGVLVRSSCKGLADTKKARRKTKKFSLRGSLLPSKGADLANFSVNPKTDAYWDQVVVHQGWLLKKGGLTRSWLKRYAVLYKTAMGHFLCYYSDFAKSPLFHSDERERNIIDLAKTTFVRPISKDREAPMNSFDICTIEREWTLSAESKQAMQTWLQCITRCVDEDVAIVPDDELNFMVKPRIDPSMQLVKDEYSTVLKVSASGVSVCHVRGENELKELFFWCYTDFFKWSILHHQNKTGLQISVFTSSDFSVKDRQEFLFRTRLAVKLATAIEFYIEKFMSAMHLYLEGTADVPTPKKTDTTTSQQRETDLAMDTKQMTKDSISPDKSAAATADLLGVWDDDDDEPPKTSFPLQQHRQEPSLLDFFSDPLPSAPAQYTVDDPFAPKQDNIEPPRIVDDAPVVPDLAALAVSPPPPPDLFVQEEEAPPSSIDVREAMQETAAFCALVNHNSAGLLYESGEVSIAVLEHEYKGSSGRLLIGIRNSSAGAMEDVEATFDGGTSGLDFELAPAPRTVAPGATASQMLVLECMRPYDEAPSYVLSFRIGAQPFELKLAIPALFTKFLEPVPLLANVFVQRWATLAAPNLQCMRTFGATQGPATADTAKPVLEAIFNVAIAQGVDDAGGTILSGATALRTATLNAGGEKISVGCLVRLEMNASAKAYRLTVRTAVPHVSTSLATAIQKLL